MTSRSGSYCGSFTSRDRPTTTGARRDGTVATSREDTELLRLIDEIRGEHEFAASYGSPRVWLELRNRGIRVGRKRVERIMRENGRKGAHLRRGWKHGSTRQNPKHTAASDLLGRDFPATAPNQKWVADLTRILTGAGVLWLAGVRDAFSNKVVGWDSGPRATTELVISALDYSIWSRDVRDGQLVQHSDKGCQGGFNWSSQHLEREVCAWVVKEGGRQRRQEGLHRQRFWDAILTAYPVRTRGWWPACRRPWDRDGSVKVAACRQSHPSPRRGGI
jgi:HTH-like domain